MDLPRATQNAAIVATFGLLTWGCSQAESTTPAINSDHSSISTTTAVDQISDGEIVGQVVDVSCYLAQGLKGDSHRQCAEICANNLNIPLNIMDDDGHLWQLVDDDMPGKDQNPTVVQYAEQRVRASGTLIEKGPNRAIIVRDVELVEGTANLAALENSVDPKLGREFNASKSAANPCEGANPCAGANPCGGNPCGGN
jgi:hypothetical protein